MIKVTAYFSASIRGKKGALATSEDMAANIDLAMKVVKPLQSIFGSLLQMYVPHAQDQLIQYLYKHKFITATQILDGDCELVAAQDILIVFSPDGYISEGMQREIDTAKIHNIPIVYITKLNDAAIREILAAMIAVLLKK